MKTAKKVEKPTRARTVEEEPETAEVDVEDALEAAAPAKQDSGAPIRGIVVEDTKSAGAGRGRESERLVKLACFRSVDPAPTVGNFKFYDYGITKLESGKTYTIPYDVAVWLVDRKVGSITE